MDREVQVNVEENETFNLLNVDDDDAFLDYEDEDELDRFHTKQTKQKIQQKRRKAAGA